MNRRWRVYEINQLIKFGIPEEKWDEFGETPVEYITGWAEFGGLDFRVTRDTLIPRIESIQLVEEAEKVFAGRDNLRVGDIGTGSGVLGITLTKRLREKGVKIEMILVDVSEKALAVAEENARRLGVALKLVQSDLLTGVVETDFDLLMANLPYIPSGRIKALPESVIGFEPHLALDGGEEGLAVIRKFLKQALPKLKPTGKIILEIDFSHDLGDFQNMGFGDIKIVRDEFGQRRLVILANENF